MKALKIILGLLLIAGAGYIAWWLLWSVGSWLFALPPETRTPVLGVTGLLLVPVITFFTTRSLERRRSLDAAVREKKTAFYDEAIRSLMRVLNVAGGKAIDEAEMKTIFANITPPLITYGSRRVILAWNKFRKASRTGDIDPMGSVFAFEGLLKAMRQDLGHSVVAHQDGELLSIFINDMEEQIAKRKAARRGPTHS